MRRLLPFHAGAREVPGVVSASEPAPQATASGRPAFFSQASRAIRRLRRRERIESRSDQEFAAPDFAADVFLSGLRLTCHQIRKTPGYRCPVAPAITATEEFTS